MNTVSEITGFYREAGVYIKCHYCKRQVRLSLSHMMVTQRIPVKAYCVFCQREFYVDVSIQTHAVATDDHLLEKGVEIAKKVYEEQVKLQDALGDCICPADGHSELCPIHKVNSSPR